MKHYLLITCIIILSKADAQNINLNTTYLLTQNLTLQTCDAVGNNPGSSQMVFRGFEFKVDKVLTNDVVIHFLKWTKDAAKNTAYFNSKSTTANTPDIYFLLPLNQFQTTIEKHRKAPFALGIAIVPIKMRFGNSKKSKATIDSRYFNFESAVSLGFSVGCNVKLDKSKFTARNNLAFLAGISLSSVPLDSFTTKGFLKTNTNNASITGHIGMLYQIDNFQIGVFTGIDYLAGEVGNQWKYRNKPWVGIGLGYSIFQAKKTTDTQ